MDADHKSLNTVPTKNLKRITLYIEPEIYETLVKWAEDDDRTISNLSSRLLTQVVKARDTAKDKGGEA